MTRLQALEKQRYVAPLGHSRLYSTLGESAQACTWLEKAYQEHARWLIDPKIGPVWDKLRADRRFTNLLRRVGLPQ